MTQNQKKRCDGGNRDQSEAIVGFEDGRRERQGMQAASLKWKRQGNGFFSRFPEET